MLLRNGGAEDGWLDEGLSKYAEELAGRSYLPGDSATFSQYAFNEVFDAYKYLTAPGSNPLLIPFDNGTLAEIGASWLFVRYAVDQYGDSLPRKLVQSSLTGAANVAAQVGQPFDAVVTRWALANWVSDLPGFMAPGAHVQVVAFSPHVRVAQRTGCFRLSPPAPAHPDNQRGECRKRERDAAGGLRSVSPCLARSERPGIHAVLQSGRQRPSARSDRGAAQRDTAPLTDRA